MVAAEAGHRQPSPLRPPDQARPRHRHSPGEGHQARHAREHRETIRRQAQEVRREIMSTIYFPAIVEGNSRAGYSVFFPDLPGLASAGDTLQEAALHAAEGLRGHVQLMVEDGLAVPAASELDAVARDPDVEEAARILVPVEVPSSRALRVNVTLPEDLLQRIDRKSANRSRFLAEAAERALAGDTPPARKPARAARKPPGARWRRPPPPPRTNTP